MKAEMVLWTAGFVLLTLVINAPLLPWVLRVTGLNKGSHTFAFLVSHPLHCTALPCTALHCSALPCTALHCSALRDTSQHTQLFLCMHCLRCWQCMNPTATGMSLLCADYDCPYISAICKAIWNCSSLRLVPAVCCLLMHD